MSSIEAWIDLAAAALAGPHLAGPVVVLHEAQRLFPLVEQRTATAWVHPEAPGFIDLLPLPNALPMRRERLSARTQADDARALLRRAAIGIFAVPTQPAARAALLALCQTAGLPQGQWIVYGEAAHLAEPAVASWLHAQGLHSVPAPGGVKLWMAPGLVQGLRVIGMSQAGLVPQFARKLVDHLPGVLNVSLQPGSAEGSLQLCLRPDPLRTVASFNDSLCHHVHATSRALFNRRGMGCVLQPWDGAQLLRLLVCNVRGHIDDIALFMGVSTLPRAEVSYVEQGALVTATLQPIAPGLDALIHLRLPREALPTDAFCDMGAIEFTAELA
jgi:hypothetical protein